MKFWMLDIYKNTQHGLALYFKVRKVNIIEVIDIPSVLETIGSSLLYAWSSWYLQ